MSILDAPPPDELEGLTAVTRADVYKGRELAAHLSRLETGSVVFAYTPDWIADGGDPVASTLPVTAENVVTTGGAVPAFFAGLLPEGRRLTALRRATKTSADDELTLLLGVGGDTIGDVRILPEEVPPKATPPRLQVESFDRVSFTDLMAQTGIRIDRVGLPGVQDKVSAAIFNLPVANADSQILLKLNPPEFKHLVENEHFFLNAAAASGIRTVQARLVTDREGLPGLAVSRFDRVCKGDASLSLAVEDGCQVLGLHPEGKYRISLEQLFTRLCSLCEAPVPSAAEFLAQAAFAYVTGNGDAHAKNFSIVRDVTGRWQPAPAYDLPSSQPYGDSTMALTLGGRRDGNLTGARFIALVRPSASGRAPPLPC